MKKIAIKRSSKYAFIFIMIIVIGVSGLLINKEFKRDRIVKTIEDGFAYESSLKSSQRAIVKKNSIYDNDVRGAGEVCISKFVENLENTFTITYKVNSLNGAKHETHTVSGNYSIKAKISAFVKDGDGLGKVWVREVNILSQTEFKKVTPSEDGILLRKPINIKIDKYNKLIDELRKMEGVSTRFDIKLIANVSINDDNGKYKADHHVNMDVPKKGDYFIIPENQEDAKNYLEEVPKFIEIPLNTKLIKLLSIVAGVMVIGLIVLILFTSGIVIDEREKLLNKIFKNHGDNVVALIEDDEVELQGAIKVKNIKDLVRIGEEVLKPILYKHSENQNDIENFYIINEKKIYVYKVEVKVENQKMDNDDGEVSEDDIIMEVSADLNEEHLDENKKEGISQDTEILNKDDVIIID